MSLSFKEMPVSFSGEALYYALGRSDWLNLFSKSESQGHVQRIKGVGSAVAFSIYTIGVGLLCAPLGALYHTAQAFHWKWNAISLADARSHALAWEHLKAGCIDLSSILLAPFAHLPLAISDGRALGWWFSSSTVRTEFAEPQLDENHARDGICPSAYWGTTPEATPHACPYNKLRVYAAHIYQKHRQILPLNDPDVLRKTCVGIFKEAHTNSQFWARIWPQRPSFLSHSYTFVRGERSPDYKIPWKAMAFAVGAVVLFALALYSLSLYLPQTISLSYVKTLGFGQLISWTGFSGALCYDQMMKKFVENRGSAELALGNRLIHAPTPDTPQGRAQARANIQEAFFWLHRAAIRGYVPAQKTFGLSLLASLPHPLDETDHNVLSIAREGISWLQAATVNAFANHDYTVQRLMTSVLPVNWARICKGITGNSEQERMRSFLESFQIGRVEAEFAIEYMRNAGRVPGQPNAVTDRMKHAGQAVRERMVESLVTSRRRAVAREVVDETSLLPELGSLIAEYVIPKSVSSSH